MRDLRWLMGRLLRGGRTDFFVTAILMVTGAAAEMLTISAAIPFLLFAIHPGGLPSGSYPYASFSLGFADPLVPAAVLLVTMAAIAAGVRIALAWFTQRMVVNLGHELASAVFAQALHRPFAKFVQRNSSDVLSGIEKVQAVMYGVVQPAMQGFVAAVLAVCIAAFLFLIQPQATAVGAASILVAYLIITLGTRGRLSQNTQTIGAMMTARTQTIQEGLGHIRDIILDRSHPLFGARFRRIDRRHRRAVADNALLHSWPRFIVEAAAIAAIAMITLTMSAGPGGVLTTIPELGAIALGAQRLLPLVQTAWQGWSQASGNIQLVKDIGALIEADFVPPGPPVEALQFKQALELKRVSFSYEDGRPVLTDASFRITRGQRVGIIGVTGSGKSTLLDLMMGLLSPEQGEIVVDGRPLDDALRPRWQAAIAHVPQAVYLSDDSIAANIALSVDREFIDFERVQEAVSVAQLSAFVAGLPAGLQTKVGERGIRLSGGQRQRIAIARAIYKRAPVLVFDEATRALDRETETSLFDALASWDRNLTMIIVTHDETNLTGCDQVVELKNGHLSIV